MTRARRRHGTMWAALRRTWRSPLWRRPVPLWAFLLVVVTMLVGFTVGLSENGHTAHTATQANSRVIAEIAARQHVGCVASNESREVLRNVVDIAIPDTPAAVAPPFPAHPDVQAYIQGFLDGAARDRSALRATELGLIPPDSNCKTIVRH